MAAALFFLTLSPAYADPPGLAESSPFGPDADYTWNVMTGDVDGDGFLDLVVGNSWQNAIYLNDGFGHFYTGTVDCAAPPENVRCFGLDEDDTRSVALGDVNSDGALDLVVGNSNQQNLVYLNDGAGYFYTGTVDCAAPPATVRCFGPGSDHTRSVVVGDIDGDGDLDLVVGNYSEQNVVYLNDGAGKFPTGHDFGPGADATTSVAIGDVDGDGALDLVVGNDGQNVVYLNDGAGNFSARNFGVASNTYTVAMGDVDGDGSLDLVVGNGTELNQVYLNDGVGNLNFSYGFGPGSDRTRIVAMGDVDGDGSLDLVVGNDSEQNVVYLNDGVGGFTLTLAFGTGADRSWGLVLADVDDNGALDLVVGNYGQQNVVYRNDGAGAFPTVHDFGPDADNTSGVAVGDVDGDGDLDLVVGNYGQHNVVYLGDGAGNFYIGPVDCAAPPESVRCFGTGVDSTGSVAAGDVDGDGDLDLVVGNQTAGQGVVYLNAGLGYFYSGPLDCTDSENVRCFGAGTDGTVSVLPVDLDGDEALDLVVGNILGQNVLYLNDGAGHFYTGTVDCAAPPENVRCFGPDSDATMQVAVDDVNGDGTIDLVVGNTNAQQNMVYLNDGAGHFYTGTVDCAAAPENARCFGPGTDWTRGVVLRDVDGDGALDLVVGNTNAQQNVTYLNDGTGRFYTGTVNCADPPESARCFGTGSDDSRSVLAGDVDGDGDLDLVVGNRDGQNVVYLNDGKGNFSAARDFGSGADATRRAALGDVNGDGSLDLVVGNVGEQNAVYINRSRLPERLPNRPPYIAVTRPVPTGNADFYSSPVILDASIISITYTLFDADADPVGRVLAYYSPNGGGRWYTATAVSGTVTTNLSPGPHVFVWDTFASGLAGQADNLLFRLEAYPSLYPQTDAIPGPYQWPYAAASSFPFRVRGTQVRVMSGTVPAVGALIYRLPAGRTTGAEPLSNAAGRPLHTNAQGYLPGSTVLGLGDRLVAVLPITVTESYTLCYTSASPNLGGLDAYTLTGTGMHTLTVSPDNPLMLLDLDVSFEWDAHGDDAFVAQLQSDLLRTSELLYDWTDGQAALGQVTVYYDHEHWSDADVQVHGSNRLHPNASQGGIVSELLTDTQVPSITYVPGHVHIGPTWNRYGDPGASQGEDWPRVLAHELGHYAFFLDDNYIGLDADGYIIPVETCPGAMANPYSPDIPHDEFHPDAGWLPACEQTLSHQFTGRSDWATISTFYPWLDGTRNNVGPSSLPLAVTRIRLVEPITPSDVLEEFTLQLYYGNGSTAAGVSARAFLFQDEWLVDLGRPTDHVMVRGAALGDEVCVYELAAQRLGCQVVASGMSQLDLHVHLDWQPEVLVTSVTSSNVFISVTHVATGLPLQARLFPSDDSSPPSITLTEVSTGHYTGSFATLQPAPVGHVQIWVDEALPQRGAVASYSLGGGSDWSRWGRRFSRYGPLISRDGQVILFGKNLDAAEGEFLSLQEATVLPGLPPRARVTGPAYWLSVSPDGPDLTEASISFQYLGREVSPLEEPFLQLYFWDGLSWYPLTTTLSSEYNLAAAPSQGPGLYALMNVAWRAYLQLVLRGW